MILSNNYVENGTRAEASLLFLFPWRGSAVALPTAVAAEAIKLSLLMNVLFL